MTFRVGFGPSRRASTTTVAATVHGLGEWEALNNARRIARWMEGIDAGGFEVDLVRLAFALGQVRSAGQAMPDAASRMDAAARLLTLSNRSSVGAWALASAKILDVSAAAFTKARSPRLRASVVLPGFAGRHFAEGWRCEKRRLHELATLAEGWDGDGGKPAALATVRYVLEALAPFATFAPAPSFSTSGEGDVWALWAGYGLDVELRFAEPGDVYAMIEDSRGEIGSYEDNDPDLERARDTLVELGNRTYASAMERSRALSGPRFFPEDYSSEAWSPEFWPAETGTIGGSLAVTTAA